MPALSWEVVASLIVQYGIPFAESIVKKAESGSPPTTADFAELRALEGQTATDKMKAQLVAAGIPLDDPKAVALLALTK